MPKNDSVREVLQGDIDKLYLKIKNDAEAGGYHLNPDEQFAKDLIKGLLKNESRYGYQSCPCRLSEGYVEKDRDIICPCDYRDADINDFGTCYCGLYVSQDILNGKKKLKSIPERRFLKSKITVKNKDGISSVKDSVKQNYSSGSFNTAGIPVWRCRVCGYLCARENPPEVCPICKVTKDRFERFF